MIIPMHIEDLGTGTKPTAKYFVVVIDSKMAIILCKSLTQHKQGKQNHNDQQAVSIFLSKQTMVAVTKRPDTSIYLSTKIKVV